MLIESIFDYLVSNNINLSLNKVDDNHLELIYANGLIIYWLNVLGEQIRYYSGPDSNYLLIDIKDPNCITILEYSIKSYIDNYNGLI